MVNEKKLKEEFEGNKGLQIEFGDDFEAFFALRKHEDEVKRQDERRDWRRGRKIEVEVDESKLQQEFSESGELQNEFHDFGTYLGFKKNELRVKILGGNVETFSSPVPGKETPISGKTGSAFKGAAARTAKIQEDEQKQYASGVPCDDQGVSLES